MPELSVAVSVCSNSTVSPERNSKSSCAGLAHEERAASPEFSRSAWTAVSRIARFWPPRLVCDAGGQNRSGGGQDGVGQAGQAWAAHSPNGRSASDTRPGGHPGRPTASSRSARSGRRSGRVARPRPVRVLRAADLEAQPPVVRILAAEPGSTPRSPGNCTLVASVRVSGWSSPDGLSSSNATGQVVDGGLPAAAADRAAWSTASAVASAPPRPSTPGTASRRPARRARRAG